MNLLSALLPRRVLSPAAWVTPYYMPQGNSKESFPNPQRIPTSIPSEGPPQLRYRHPLPLFYLLLLRRSG